MKKKILLPTDFSKNAWNAITFARALYKNETCDFYLLNTFQVSGYALEGMMIPEPGDRAYEAAKLKSEQGLSKTIARLSVGDPYPNHNYFVLSQFNSIQEGINDSVEKQDIDMVIMGTKGASNATDVIYGSNTVLAMEKTRNCPVMAVPGSADYVKMREIVFPTDFKTNIKRRELQNLIDVVQLSNANLCILHIAEEDHLSEDQEQNKKRLEECFEGLRYSFHTLHAIDVNAGLRCFVESRNSDMITFFNRKHRFFGSIFSKPMVKNLGYHSVVPVLALHDFKN